MAGISIDVSKGRRKSPARSGFAAGLDTEQVADEITPDKEEAAAGVKRAPVRPPPQNTTLPYWWVGVLPFGLETRQIAISADTMVAERAAWEHEKQQRRLLRQHASMSDTDTDADADSASARRTPAASPAPSPRVARAPPSV